MLFISLYYYFFEWFIFCVYLYSLIGLQKIISLLQGLFFNLPFSFAFPPLSLSPYPSFLFFLFKLAFLKLAFFGDFLKQPRFIMEAKSLLERRVTLRRMQTCFGRNEGSLGPGRCCKAGRAGLESAIRQRNHCTWEASRCQQTAFVSPFMLINFCENLHVN